GGWGAVGVGGVDCRIERLERGERAVGHHRNALLGVAGTSQRSAVRCRNQDGFSSLDSRPPAAPKPGRPPRSREFRTVGAAPSEPAMPVDEYIAGLDRLIETHDYFKQDRVVPAIGRGEAAREVVQRLSLEFYYLGKWMTPEFAVLVAN